MKTKTLSLLASISLLSFASCTNDMQELAVYQSQTLEQIVMTTQDFQLGTDSRTAFEIASGAINCTWAANDTVGVFPDEGIQTAFPMASGAGTKNATFDGGGWALKDGNTYAAYYPCIGDFYLDKHAVPVSYSGQTQVGDASTAHLGAYDYMVATPTAPQFGSANFVFKHLSALVQLKITVPEPATLTSVKLLRDSGWFALKGEVDIMASTPCIDPKTSTNTMTLHLQDVTTTEENQVVTLYMMIPPADLTESDFIAEVWFDTPNLSGKHKTFSLPRKKLEAGKAYSFSMEMPSLYYRTVTMEEAGTLSSVLQGDTATIQRLKIIGPINGDDIRLLRYMAGVNLRNENIVSQLNSLDLSEARIVEGGDYYATSEKWAGSSDVEGDYYMYTENDVFGPFMFCYSNLAEIKLPETITEIGNLALFDCNSLTKLTVPETVTIMGIAALMHCDSIVEVVLPKNLTVMRESMFRACFSLKDIPVWPSNITQIPFATFAACTSFVNVSIPDNVTDIGESAFWDCSGLQRIEIPASVNNIQNYAFNNCDSLKTLVCYPITPPTIGREAFYNVARIPKLYVPMESCELYRKKNGWYQFYGTSYVYSIEYDLEYD